jgi:uncharacterized protein (TIGR02611 family)
MFAGYSLPKRKAMACHLAGDRDGIAPGSVQGDTGGLVGEDHGPGIGTDAHGREAVDSADAATKPVVRNATGAGQQVGTDAGRREETVTTHEPHRRRRRLRHRVRRRIRRNRTLDATWRVGVFVVGAVFVLAGLIMFVTPGPGWMAIILGLAILATEFAWAQRILHWSRERARAASAKALDPKVRRRNLLIASAVIVLVAAGGWWWVASFGWPPVLIDTIDWVRSWR